VSGDGSTIAVAAARAIAFLALCGFAALTWMNLLDPAATPRAGYALLAATAAMLGLLAAGRLRGRARTLAAALVAAGSLALALLGGGVADELLRPDHWSELASGIGRGISSLPGARVPYRGLDEWTRIVLGAGGTVLAVAAALAAFWPRRRTLGLRNVSLVLLVTLYAVPAVALDLGAQMLSGAVLAVLVVAYLRLDRLRVGDTGAAVTLALAVTILGMVAAPTLDTDEPWFDYETWALSNAASKTTAFSWEHSYGPLGWPRDGRELLRVKARRPAYWKAVNLDEFDGRRWVRASGGDNADNCDLDAYSPDQHRRWLQEITVSVRNLRTETFVTAGITCLLDARVTSLPLGDGTYSVATRALRRGDAYQALVYTPAANERERRAAAETIPSALGRFTRVAIPGELPPNPGAGGVVTHDVVQFAPLGTGLPPLATPSYDPGSAPQPAPALLARSGYARTYALARRLGRGADSQEDYVQAVQRHLRGEEFTYTEAPPPAAENLDGFLFDAKTGYCQQFSGAMALLLRMGGVPARVSTGFTSGSYDRKAREYVVRDLDAHSWVEVWYPGIGWVTFDPTPSLAPARSQADEGGPSAEAVAMGVPDLGGDIRSDTNRGPAAADEASAPWPLIAGAGAGALAVAALGVWLLRRHRRRLAAGWGPLAELERALVRTRRAPGPAATLRTVESALGRTPAAAGYVRALREQRYGTRPVSPSPAGRRAVRAELGRGGGLPGRLRAWWALPPRPR
jgi:protein-glutamine gamma-glutamyltransferase